MGNRQIQIAANHRHMVNEREVIRSLREKGYYSSGVPQEGTRSGKAKAARRIRHLTRDELRSMTQEEVERYFNDMKRSSE